MIYHDLADYYDDLVKDEQATQNWADLTENTLGHQRTKILELACGSAEISCELASRGYSLLATDLSEDMLNKAKLKHGANKLRFAPLNMVQFDLNETFDAVICFCDSINYLSSLEEVKSMIHSVKRHLNEQGIFIFDMHTPDRLEEFAEEFIEEGMIDGVAYQWTIASQDDEIHHHFAFWKENEIMQEFHVQHVFDLKQVLNLLHEEGFDTEVFVDFDQPETASGEKYFVIGKLS